MKQEKQPKWFKLDNAGKLYPSIMNTRVTTVFRISAILDEVIDPVTMQLALDETIKVFPFFKVHLKRGIFWYYFNESQLKPLIQPETFYPCMFLRLKKKNTFPFRVVYFEKRISCEFSHSITDGSGAFDFLKHLLTCYYQPHVSSKNTKLEQPMAEHYEDAFSKHYNPNVPSPDKNKKALHFSFPLLPKGEYRIITGCVLNEELISKAKMNQCTLTQYLLVLYFETLQEYFENHDTNGIKGPIAINMPINLRKMFPSDTKRNFFISLSPHIDTRLGHYSRDEIIQYVKGYMTLNVNYKEITKAIKRNVAYDRSIGIRLIPLGIKNILMPTIYYRWGERGYTSSLSNVGLIQLPEQVEAHVSALEVIPPPSIGNIIKIAVVGYKDKTYISFGKMTSDAIIERLFFRKMIKEGIRVKISSNGR